VELYRGLCCYLDLEYKNFSMADRRYQKPLVQYDELGPHGAWVHF